MNARANTIRRTPTADIPPELVALFDVDQSPPNANDVAVFTLKADQSFSVSQRRGNAGFHYCCRREGETFFEHGPDFPSLASALYQTLEDALAAKA